MPNLHEYLDQLEILEEQNTQYYIRCPNCEGKIALSKNYPYKFLCVTNYCDCKDIFKSLGVNVSPYKDTQVRLPVKPLHIERNIKLNYISNYKLPVSYQYKSPYKEYLDAVIKRTEYNYGKTHRVVRNDVYKSEQDCMNDLRDSKTFIIQSKDKSNSWSNTKGYELYGHNIPIFNEEYILNGTDLLIVEGEQCAVDFTNKLGILACTFLGSCWNEDYFKAKLSSLFHVIGGVVIIPDVDKPGKKKCETLCNAAWQLCIPTKVIDISKFVDIEKKEDIGDLVNAFPEDTKLYIESYAKTYTRQS